MDDLTGLSVDRFLDALAERKPTPGGGGVAAVAGALSCAMARMVAAYSVRKETAPAAQTRIESVAQRLQNTDELLRALVTRDAEAYNEMTAVAKRAREDPSARGNYEKAIMAAIGVPLQIAALAAEALSEMDEFKTVASRYLLSDLGVAAVLADATARAARYCVQVNARELQDPATRMKLLQDIDETVSRCARSRASVESFVSGQFEGEAPDIR